MDHLGPVYMFGSSRMEFLEQPHWPISKSIVWNSDTQKGGGLLYPQITAAFWWWSTENILKCTITAMAILAFLSPYPPKKWQFHNQKIVWKLIMWRNCLFFSVSWGKELQVITLWVFNLIFWYLLLNWNLNL